MSDTTAVFELDISTLLHGSNGRQGDSVQAVFNKSTFDIELSRAEAKDALAPEIKRPKNCIEHLSRLENEDNEDKRTEDQSHVVRGEDIGDLPTEYVVRGLNRDEMPVIGRHAIS